VSVDVAVETAAEPRDTRRRFALITVGLVMLAVVVGGISLARGWEFSPYDEAAHVDYAWKVSHGELPYAGSTIEPEVLAEWSCHGQSNVPLPACGTGAPPSDYPARGENYLQHPPVYYAITGVIARALPLEYIGADFTTSARLTSIAWLALGMVLFYRALRVWNVPWRVAVLAATLPPCFHLVLLSSVSVTNDVTALPAGAAAMLLLGRVLVRRTPSVALFLVATAFFTGAKVLNALPFLGIATVLLLAAIRPAWTQRLGLRRRDAVATAAGIVGVVAAINFGATIVRRLTREAGWISPVAGVNSDDVVGLPFREWMGTFFAGFISTGTGVAPTAEITDPSAAWEVMLRALIWAAPLAALVLVRFLTPDWSLAAATAVALLALPTVVQLQTFISSGGTQYFPGISARYALSLLPLQVACLAIVVARRRWLVAAYVVVGGAWLAWVAGILTS
jgi:hypothetical protein